MASAGGKLFFFTVVAAAVSFLPIWRGAGHPRTEGVSFWRMLRDSTHLTPDSPFGHPHLPYEEAVRQARAAYQEKCG